ncbi:MAG: tRNA-dihydrouridine synthase [Candidatus Doudnabacteria bacterium]
MNRGFWDKLKKPIFVLAPMANVTDAAFRFLIAKYGKPDVTWTEFVSADGLVSEGLEKLLVDFWYSETERPIVAQIFGAKPENFYKVAKLIKDLGFDGIDINMGCPDRAVLKQGAGGALIKNPKLAQEIILAAKEGASVLPVSVKTRLGVGKIDIENWIPELLKTDIAAITIHLRTVKELSLVPAHWEIMPQVVELINQLTTKENRPLILGNGDVLTLTEAEQKISETGADGVMIGRGIFGNPWMFNKETPIEKIPVHKRLQAMIEHSKLFEEKFVNLPMGGKRFEVMKKHYKAYVNGFDGAKELRMKLMETKNAQEVEQIVSEFARSDAMRRTVAVK